MFNQMSCKVCISGKFPIPCEKIGFQNREFAVLMDRCIERIYKTFAGEKRWEIDFCL